MALPEYSIRLPVSQLQLGMYVSELDRPWAGTPFLFQGFPIQSVHDLRALQDTCEFVWVDRRQSRSVTPLAANLAAGEQTKTYAIDYREAVKATEPVWREARAVSMRLLDAVKFGQELDVSEVRRAVGACVESVLKHPAASLWLARIKQRDHYTAEHCLRVSLYAIALGKALGMLPLELEELGVCGMLHDVGKIKVPDEILNKPGRLTDEEFRIMQAHTTYGYQLLMGNSEVPPAAVDVAHTHHERMDGKGYPRQLPAQRIPFKAKIIAVVDAYDAITSDRAYSEGRSSLEALRILFEARGTQFDETVVLAFIQLIGVYPPGEIVELSTGEVGIIIGFDAGSKLKPRVLVVLDADKQPRLERVLDLARNPLDAADRLISVRAVKPSGAYGIDIDAYRAKGLVVPA
ncbi:HD-GYP domain-containing protein [Pseudomonas sp. 102515]|uniref:HD-GYP domain-containing protein n=1 Tax=Pseudomonas sp. 102515 TaxID=3071568 RepID=UPI0028009E71|nr:HD-GYP domain-containing protein [Pseudomonas sp. 102515]MDQ7911931.1 HD-GYP domain-containing protein [Pseudomonas sp. 102515]